VRNPFHPNKLHCETDESKEQHGCRWIEHESGQAGCNEINRPLAHIFNLSVSNGIFPSRLRISRTFPIFKSGDPLLTENYPPIYLLITLSKILEKIIFFTLLRF